MQPIANCWFGLVRIPGDTPSILGRTWGRSRHVGTTANMESSWRWKVKKSSLNGNVVYMFIHVYICLVSIYFSMII